MLGYEFGVGDGCIVLTVALPIAIDYSIDEDEQREPHSSLS